MRPETIHKLHTLNLHFYQKFAHQFSSTRMRLKPGVQRILITLPDQIDILELGCGNGELALELVKRSQKGVYMGLDFSPEILSIAIERVNKSNKINSMTCDFLLVDLASPDWDNLLSGQTFDIALAFAVLHHIPSYQLRRLTLQKLRTHLRLITNQGVPGRFIHSEWQFLNSERLRTRIQPWETIGLKAEDVEEGDYLLDWRHGGLGLRYVHHFSINELEALAQETDFIVRDTFFSDGEGNNLGLYQIWEMK